MGLRIYVRVIAASLLLTGAAGSVVNAQSTDSLTTARQDSVEDAHTPRGALWRAAVLPGWGQFYNDQYLKIPVVYGTLGGITTAALAFNHQYLKYRHAYLYQAWQEEVDQGAVDEHPYPQYEDEHARLIDRTGPLSSEVLRRQRDKLRRNRDLMYIGLGIAYGLTIVDAYVSAHLADFDVSDDLSLQVAPNGHQVRLKFTFN